MSAKKEIFDSVNELIQHKIKNKEFYLLAQEITYIVNNEYYEYQANTNGAFNQPYYDRCVNEFLRVSMYKQGSNKSFGMPFPFSSSQARVIYLGEY